ncbi:MAG TPA: SDR family oxidoreductase [Acidimicrobiales bacterium]
MSDSHILQGKRAVVFGAGGSIGAAVAKAFAVEGAEVFLSGRSAESLTVVEKAIADKGGIAHSDVVDALDEAAVTTYLEAVAGQAGGIDVSINATGPRISAYGNGKPAVQLPVDEFMSALNTVLKSQFITAHRVADHMLGQGSGVIILLTGSPAKPHTPGTSGIGAAFAAVENLTRTMAMELGNAGVRVVCLRTAANPDTRTIRDTCDLLAAMRGITADQAVANLAESTLLKRSPHTDDTAKAAVLLASDLARMMTGTVHNATAGVCPD